MTLAVTEFETKKLNEFLPLGLNREIHSFFSFFVSHTGKITLGSNRDADILVAGTGVEPVHCAIENNNGVVTLYPINGNTFVDGVPINSPVRLAQGKRPWPKYV